MNKPPQDAWFFTREGERIGPVTLADLRVKAQESALDPRLDMVWTQGMAEWKPAAEIEGLFGQRTAVEAQESLAPAADVYAPPKLGSVAEMMSREGAWPGARRRSFISAVILFPIVWSFVLPLGSVFLTGLLGPEITGVIGIGAAFLPLLVGVYFGLMRLVNLGMSRWWYFANFVPILNLWIGYRCFACPAGYAYHKKLDGAGVALAILYWLLVVLTVLVIVAVVALMLGVIDSPAIQEQLLESLRAAGNQATQP